MLKTDVLIVGAGPVGLFLGCCLAKLDINFKIIEKRTERINHSRAVGIHPPSLELFEKLSIEKPFLDAGVHIPAGKAFANHRELGTLSFKHCPPPFPFILTLPQFQTEQILEQSLNDLAPDCLKRGTTLTSFSQDDVLIIAKYKTESESHNIQTSYIIACDGKDSLVRELAGISFNGEAYPDTYIMGDFQDNTNLENQAGIYLTDDGLVESFPLPNQVRRWVVKTDKYIPEPSKEQLASLVQSRLKFDLPIDTNSMMSSFGVQHFLASSLVKDRIILAGDAAHVLSPIGGQGMNLGWLDAWDLSHALQRIIQKDQDALKTFKLYEAKRKKAAQVAIRRAAFNMQLGRKTRLAKLKYGFIRFMLNTPLERVFAYIFTMRWL